MVFISGALLLLYNYTWNYACDNHTLIYIFPSFQVILPSLHISLGVYKKLFDLLEDHCHKIDIRVFKLRLQHTDLSDVPECKSNFDQQILAAYKAQQKLQTDIDRKKSELEEIEEELPLQMLYGQIKGDDHLSNVAQRAVQLRTQLQNLVGISCKPKCTRRPFLINIQGNP